MKALKKALGGGGSKDGGGGSAAAGSYSGQTFLHGHLDVEIRAGQNLPDLEGWVSKLYDQQDVTDPFVDMKLGKAKLAKTR